MKRFFFLLFFLGLGMFLSVTQCQAQNLDENGKLPRATPESQGVESENLLKMLESLRDEVHSINSVMVLRHGKVVAEAWRPPHSPETTHAMYSLSKSFTSTAAGFAAAEGKLSLDAKLVDLFADDLPPEEEISENLKNATVRDLLMMGCGQEREPHFKGLFPIDFERDANETWTQTFLKQPFVFKPGTHFMYNTAGTYMVSAALQKATGQTVRDYLIPRLFEPLHIEAPFWEQSPTGVSKGGTGLFLHTEDIAKVGQLYLQNGMWNGNQILPESWVRDATSSHISNGNNPDSDWAQGYGYQFWRCRFNIFRGDGMFSQFIIVMPDQDVVVAVTSDSNAYQNVLNIVFKHLCGVKTTAALPENTEAAARLKALEASLPVQDGDSGSVVLENLRIPSRILGRDTTYSVYLPNGYLTTGFEYPVLYLLHGGGDVGDAWLKKGNLKEIADKFFENRDEKAIIVMPYCEDARWRNDFKGVNRYEDYFFEELIPTVEKTFRCRKDPRFRAVSGLSRGGYGSLLYAFHRPDVFGTCFAMSPAIRSHEQVESMPEEEFLKLYATCVSDGHKAGDARLTPFFLEHDILTYVQNIPSERKESLRLFMDCGDDDAFSRGCSLLHLELLDAQIPHELRFRDGAHNWEYWKASLPLALDFFLTKP